MLGDQQSLHAARWPAEEGPIEMGMAWMGMDAGDFVSWEPLSTLNEIQLQANQIQARLMERRKKREEKTRKNRWRRGWCLLLLLCGTLCLPLPNILEIRRLFFLLISIGTLLLLSLFMLVFILVWLLPEKLLWIVVIIQSIISFYSCTQVTTESLHADTLKISKQPSSRAATKCDSKAERWTMGDGNVKEETRTLP